MTTTKTLLNDTRKDDLIALAGTLGNKEGNGLNAKPDLARAVLDASIAGVIGTEHAAEIWAKYSNSMRKTLGLEATRNTTEKGDKVRVSELKRFIFVGAMPQVNPDDLFTRAITIINGNEVKGSTYENLVKIMREQASKDDAPLTDEEIMGVLFPQPAEKDEKVRLEAILKTMKRTHDGTKGDPDKGVPPQAGFPSDELAEAIVQIEARLATFAHNARVKLMLEIAAENPDAADLIINTRSGPVKMVGIETAAA
jgi:hypothetical protein